MAFHPIFLEGFIAHGNFGGTGIRNGRFDPNFDPIIQNAIRYLLTSYNSEYA